MALTLVQELNILHASYVEAINIAIADGDPDRAERLARDYDDEAILLMATREDKLDLLPLQRPEPRDTPLRRLARRVGSRRAA